MKYLLLLLMLAGCTHSRGEHRCTEIYTKEFGKTVCQTYQGNGSGCWGYKCDTDFSYNELVTIRCDGNALIMEDVECP